MKKAVKAALVTAAATSAAARDLRHIPPILFNPQSTCPINFLDKWTVSPVHPDIVKHITSTPGSSKSSVVDTFDTINVNIKKIEDTSRVEVANRLNKLVSYNVDSTSSSIPTLVLRRSSPLDLANYIAFTIQLIDTTNKVNKELVVYVNKNISPTITETNIKNAKCAIHNYLESIGLNPKASDKYTNSTNSKKNIIDNNNKILSKTSEDVSIKTSDQDSLTTINNHIEQLEKIVKNASSEKPSTGDVNQLIKDISIIPSDLLPEDTSVEDLAHAFRDVLLKSNVKPSKTSNKINYLNNAIENYEEDYKKEINKTKTIQFTLSHSVRGERPNKDKLIADLKKYKENLSTELLSEKERAIVMEMPIQIDDTQRKDVELAKKQYYKKLDSNLKIHKDHEEVYQTFNRDYNAFIYKILKPSIDKIREDVIQKYIQEKNNNIEIIKVMIQKKIFKDLYNKIFDTVTNSSSSFFSSTISKEKFAEKVYEYIVNEYSIIEERYADDTSVLKESLKEFTTKTDEEKYDISNYLLDNKNFFSTDNIKNIEKINNILSSKIIESQVKTAEKQILDYTNLRCNARIDNILNILPEGYLLPDEKKNIVVEFNNDDRLCNLDKTKFSILYNDFSRFLEKHGSDTGDTVGAFSDRGDKVIAYMNRLLGDISDSEVMANKYLTQAETAIGNVGLSDPTGIQTIKRYLDKADALLPPGPTRTASWSDYLKTTLNRLRQDQNAGPGEFKWGAKTDEILYFPRNPGETEEAYKDRMEKEGKWVPQEGNRDLLRPSTFGTPRGQGSWLASLFGAYKGSDALPIIANPKKSPKVQKATTTTTTTTINNPAHSERVQEVKDWIETQQTKRKKEEKEEEQKLKKLRLKKLQELNTAVAKDEDLIKNYEDKIKRVNNLTQKYSKQEYDLNKQELKVSDITNKLQKVTLNVSNQKRDLKNNYGLKDRIQSVLTANKDLEKAKRNLDKTIKEQTELENKLIDEEEIVEQKEAKLENIAREISKISSDPITLQENLKLANINYDNSRLMLENTRQKLKRIDDTLQNEIRKAKENESERQRSKAAAEWERAEQESLLRHARDLGWDKEQASPPSPPSPPPSSENILANDIRTAKKKHAAAIRETINTIKTFSGGKIRKNRTKRQNSIRHKYTRKHSGYNTSLTKLHNKHKKKSTIQNRKVNKRLKKKTHKKYKKTLKNRDKLSHVTTHSRKRTRKR